MPRDAERASTAQIPWGDEFEHETARELFGSNLLALTWIKGEPMPGKLVEEVLRGLGLERETETQAKLRRRSSSRQRAPSFGGDDGGPPGAREHAPHFEGAMSVCA